MAEISQHIPRRAAGRDGQMAQGGAVKMQRMVLWLAKRTGIEIIRKSPIIDPDRCPYCEMHSLDGMKLEDHPMAQKPKPITHCDYCNKDHDSRVMCPEEAGVAYRTSEGWRTFNVDALREVMKGATASLMEPETAIGSLQKPGKGLCQRDNTQT